MMFGDYGGSGEDLSYYSGGFGYERYSPCVRRSAQSGYPEPGTFEPGILDFENPIFVLQSQRVLAYVDSLRRRNDLNVETDPKPPLFTEAVSDIEVNHAHQKKAGRQVDRIITGEIASLLSLPFRTQ